MGHTSSSAKRARQYAENRARNNAVKSQIKAKKRDVVKALGAKDKDALKKAYAELCSALDKAAKKGTIKKETAVRRKARAAKALRTTLNG